MAGGQPSGPPVAVPEGYTLLKEGQATILQHGNDVFYNPAQVINRDLSIAVLRYFVQQRREEIAAGKIRRIRRPRPATLPAAVAASAPEASAISANGEEASVPAGAGTEAQNSSAAVPASGSSGATGAAGDSGGALDPDIRILEGLAASGLRSIRYALEIDGVKRIDANDLDETAAAAVRRNLEYNDPKASGLVRPTQGDVRLMALQNPDGYEAVDLDPYGSPAQFLDSAVQAVSEGGLLLVTATDMAVLCGNNGEACWGKYGSYPLHKPYCHEQALRIVLACIEAHANRYKRHIVPVLSLSIDFYVRIFVRVYTSPEVVKESATKQMYVWQSSGCDSFYTQRIARKFVNKNSTKYSPGAGPAVPEKCPETGSGFQMGGPMWAGPIHDPSWIQGLLDTMEAEKERYSAFGKIRGLLTSASEELLDVPLYYNLHAVCKTLHVTPPSGDTVRSALINAGYRVSGSHANPLGLKTDAPPEVFWDVMRCWVLEHPTKKAPEADSYAGKLLAKPPQLKASFVRAKGATSAAKTAKVARFLPNPEAFWGPKPKAGRPQKKLGGHAAENGEGQAHGTLTIEAEAATEAADTGAGEQPMPVLQNGALDTEVAGATDIVMAKPEEIANAL
ncbi:g2328 [Coccomyxa elongata]